MVTKKKSVVVIFEPPCIKGFNQYSAINIPTTRHFLCRDVPWPALRLACDYF